MGRCGRLIIFALFLILFGSSSEMAIEKVAIFDNDKVIEFVLSPEDATRARNAKEESSLNNPGSDDGINNSESDGGFYRWTTSCVLLMLQTYKENEEKFTNGKQSQKKIWEEIAKILKCNGHNITGPMCAAKLRSLKKTYKAVKDHNNKSGNDRRSWQFFEIMDEIFSKKAWCVPLAIASSSGLSEKREKENADVESDNSKCTIELSSSKQNANTLLGKRLQQKQEYEEAKAKRHKERMEMDKKFLAVLEKLVNK